MRYLFEDSRDISRSHHESFGGVKVNENSLFLYKSDQANALIRWRLMDYFLAISTMIWLTGYSTFLIVPVVVATLSFPRKLSAVTYFTYHAELLPHTEQVVFHKSWFFGKVKRSYVDIKNLEKIDAEQGTSKIV